MFTGIIQANALVKRADISGGSMRLVVECSLPALARTQLGDSVALNGLCLTVVQKSPQMPFELHFDVSEESLARSMFGALRPGMNVHVERAMELGDPLGGHVVSGHVDALGTVTAARASGEYFFVEVEVAGEARDRVAPFLVEKGSIGIDGVSLTVNSVTDEKSRTLFSVLLIPHSLEKTHLGKLQAGDRVNLEADMLAKYVARSSAYARLEKTP